MFVQSEGVDLVFWTLVILVGGCSMLLGQSMAQSCADSKVDTDQEGDISAEQISMLDGKPWIQQRKISILTIKSMQRP
jgi:hypothetical protein